MSFRKNTDPAQIGSPSTAAEDRRRPGRLGQISPQLTSLLRNPATTDGPPCLSDQLDAPPLDDDLAPLKGIISSLVLGVLLWTVIGTAIWAVLR